MKFKILSKCFGKCEIYRKNEDKLRTEDIGCLKACFRQYTQLLKFTSGFNN